MPVRDAERYVSESIRSILNQTFGDFEFLILDDASTDETWRVLKSFAKQDRRIRLFRNERAEGIGRALRKLAGNVSGKYVARMDADDISMPTRFAVQLQHMEEENLDVCGSWVVTFGNGRMALRKHPVTDEEIRAVLLFVSPFTHSAVMMKRWILERHPYRPPDRGDLVRLEDNDLWVRMAGDARMGNVPVPLVKYREHAQQVSAGDVDGLWREAGEHGLAYLRSAYGIVPTKRQREIHIGVRHPKPPATLSEIGETEGWLLSLRELFPARSSARNVVSEQWYRYAVKCASLGPGVYRRFRRSSLCDDGNYRWWQHVAVAALSLLRVRYNSRIYRFLVARSPAARV